MSGFTDTLRHAFSASVRADARLPMVLNRFRDPQEDTLQLAQALVDCLRPSRRGDDGVFRRYQRLVDMLEADPTLADLFRTRLLQFAGSRSLITFFTDSGILPDSGFFSEWWRILGNRLLPELMDERRFKDCVRIIYRQPDDWQWQEQLPPELVDRLWAILGQVEQVPGLDWRSILNQLLDAILLLAHRISGLGVDSELMRAAPDFESHMPRFVALSSEALALVNACREAPCSPQLVSDNAAQLLVIVEQCLDTLARIHKRARISGTSLHLTYQLTRGNQSLSRLRQLVELVVAAQGPAPCEEADVTVVEGAVIATAPPPAAPNIYTRFTRAAMIAENRRNSLSHYLRQLSGLLAIRVTSNAARSGEHYICESGREYRQMWLSAAGAGIVIGGMALLKVFAAGLHAPLFVEAFLFSMIYGLGFVLIFLLGMTVATKQPAMTAQTIAVQLSDLRPNRTAEVERMVDVFAAVCRSQLAAIFGNVLLAFPVAIGLSYGVSLWLGAPAITTAKADHLLADLDVLGWALPHAAIAGFYLFLSGLLTGYFDNRATYSEIGARIARLRPLRFFFGNTFAERIGAYCQNNLGGIMGNFLFGCMLGSTGVLGTILGLPLDIRHIAFASANLGFAVTAHDFALPLRLFLYGALGVALIGLTNLVVSFSLALRTALRARDADVGHWWPLCKAIGQRLLRQPRSFFLP